MLSISWHFFKQIGQEHLFWNNYLLNIYHQSWIRIWIWRWRSRIRIQSDPDPQHWSPPQWSQVSSLSTFRSNDFCILQYLLWLLARFPANPLYNLQISKKCLAQRSSPVRDTICILWLSDCILGTTGYTLWPPDFTLCPPVGRLQSPGWILLPSGSTSWPVFVQGDLAPVHIDH